MENSGAYPICRLSLQKIFIPHYTNARKAGKFERREKTRIWKASKQQTRKKGKIKYLD